MKKTALPLVVSLVILPLLHPFAAVAATRDVCKTGCAYTLVQAAIDASTDGDTVWVHDGTYVENIDFKGKAIKVRSVSGPASTLLDGDASGSVVTFGTGEGAGSVLEGFTLTNGNAFQGGGIHCSDSSPIIRDCVVTGNRASWGGGIALVNSPAAVTRCTVNGNTVTDSGGGIYVSGNTGSLQSAITDCTVSENTAYDGGGLALYSSAAVTGCTISGNSVTYIGGGILVYMSSPVISRCTVSGNNATEEGGGISFRYSDGAKAEYSEISANQSYLGGGISVRQCAPSIHMCAIRNNYGYGGGGMEGHNQGNPTVSRCIISGNFGRVGGGLYLWDDSHATVANCTISGNRVYAGGGVLCELSSTLAITNSTIGGNVASSEGGGTWIGSTASLTAVNVVVWGNAPTQIEARTGAATSLTWSDVEGGDPGNPGSPWPGAGNIEADPLFVSPRPYSEAPTAGGDYRLRDGSPCVDVGTSDGAPDIDQAGDPRPQGAGYDMGADEFALLYNGSFEEVEERVPVPWSGRKLGGRDGRVTNTAHGGTSSFRVIGSMASKRLTQTVDLSGAAGDAFVLEGWSRARRSLRQGGFYGLEATFFYTDGTKETFRAAFTRGTHAWEHKRRTVAAGKAYDKVVVSLTFARQGGKAWFDDLALSRAP